MRSNAHPYRDQFASMTFHKIRMTLLIRGMTRVATHLANVRRAIVVGAMLCGAYSPLVHGDDVSAWNGLYTGMLVEDLPKDLVSSCSLCKNRVGVVVGDWVDVDTDKVRVVAFSVIYSKKVRDDSFRPKHRGCGFRDQDSLTAATALT